MTMPWALRGQEGLLPVRIGQVDPDGLDARRLYPGQRLLDVGDEEVEVVWARAAAGQEAVEEGRAGAPGGCQQLDFRTRGEFHPRFRTPLSTTRMPASARMVSNRAGNFPSRSLIRNRARQPASSWSITRFLAA